MTIAIWCVLAAGLLPYVVLGPAAAKLDSLLPRASARSLEGLPARAYGAHLNHFETFPLFAIAVLVAQTLEGANATVNWLAVLYIAIRIAYTFFYLSNLQPFRSISFFIGLFVAIAIFVHPAFH
jgi:uncharacterized MAPEG superfamily protein